MTSASEKPDSCCFKWCDVAGGLSLSARRFGLGRLDLVLAKKLASQIVLEPVGEEDLEADLADDDLGSIASGIDRASYRLVIQAKLRDTGPWRATEIVALLKHGKERVPRLSASPFARISADRVARILAIARALPSSFARALRSPPDRGVG